MKRLATVLLLVAALAAASTAFAQVQRWEYAWLWRLSAFQIAFTTPGFTLGGGAAGHASPGLAADLVALYGRPPNLTDEYIELGVEVALLTLIGYGGWELVHFDPAGKTVFKRPLP